MDAVGDMLAMVAGFLAPSRLPVWVTITITLTLEAFTVYMIRDNLTLNIIMLIAPQEFDQGMAGRWLNRDGALPWCRLKDRENWANEEYPQATATSRTRMLPYSSSRSARSSRKR